MLTKGSVPESRRLLRTKIFVLSTTRAITITADASIEDLAELMVGRRANPIPVVENGRLAGIVSRSDIVRWMAKGVAE